MAVLTIAIPNRNGERYIVATLESLQRNRPHVRWFLQDSCSEDRSVAIAHKYAGVNDHIIVESDSGQSDGLNRAFRSMGGEIIGYLNSDDVLADGAAEAVLETFDKYPEVDLVYGEVEWIDENSTITGRHCGDISTVTEMLDIYNVWWADRQWVQPEVFWRRSLWERVGAFSSEYDLAFDYQYWVRCFLAGVAVRRIPRVLARFRRHPDQKSIRAREAACEVRQAALEGLQMVPRMNCWDKLRIVSSLEYDRYHAGQDHRGRGFLSLISSHPHWLLSAAVRKRLYKSVRARVARPAFR